MGPVLDSTKTEMRIEDVGLKNRQTKQDSLSLSLDIILELAHVRGFNFYCLVTPEQSI